MEKIIENMKGKKILVIGDLMLDKYVEGDVTRINPEAPVPVVKVDKEYYKLGGAGNVASNVVSLLGECTLISFCGMDSERLEELMNEKGIKFLLDKNHATIEKTRVLGKNQHLIRFDKENSDKKMFSHEMRNQIIELSKEADMIIISDYAKGAVTKDLMDLLGSFRSKIIVDPKPENKELYKDAFLIKPNEKEAREMCPRENINEVGRILKEELNSHVLITRGEKGISLFSDKVINIPTFAKEVYDVTGAGDSVIAALALSIAGDASLEEAAIIGNHVAGITVEKRGAYSVEYEELKRKFMVEGGKIVDLGMLKEKVGEHKKKGHKTVWTNGCFDLLHVGHLRYLKEAKKTGDVLIVGINSDESVKKIKGPDRPIQNEKERAEILASLEFVDYIYIFSEEDTTMYLKELEPDVYVKGGDYNIDTINQDERKIIESYGGKIEVVSNIGGKSTTNVIDKIKSQNEG